MNENESAPFGGRLAVSVEEAGDALGLSRSLAYRAANAGEIPSVRIGRRLLVPVPALLRMLGSPDEREDPQPVEPVTLQVQRSSQIAAETLGRVR
ncbi:helix-turn-helix domain-containing protein [Cellulosimicrobium cellulans]|uniref:helix-turn-helix domain-containing protein n=1 Tax=Cellulosimicrobium cellulans TaxID=1710 RepID=UPI001EDACF9F|nr:helix-turn-helix domain-containing protein [Cellulosimicrobium cellulans]UKJ63502.1 helix-turn-helix domain-containing protein [Cellulosimicrobium cellulans]